MIAFPAPLAVTSPFCSTVAIAVSLDVHLNSLLSAFSGSMLANKISFWFFSNVIDVLFKLTLVTGTKTLLTITSHVAVFPPYSVVTIIVVLPGSFAVIFPLESTSAILVLIDLQVTFLLSASIDLL